MVFPQVMTDIHPERERFDVEFDLPDHFLPEFPPPLFLVSRPDLGDVSRGQEITNENFYELFDGVLSPVQFDGVRLLVEKIPQQQFNATDDRKTVAASRGVSCFDCRERPYQCRVSSQSGQSSAILALPYRVADSSRRQHTREIRIEASPRLGRRFYGIREPIRVF